MTDRRAQGAATAVPPRDGSSGARSGARLALAIPAPWVFGALDAVVVGFAVWTLVYHAALAVGGWLATTTFLSAVVVALVLIPGAWLVMRRRIRPRGRPRPLPESGAGHGPVIPIAVVLAACGAAVLSLVANRPDADDVFYVNRSSAVAQLGLLPLRDTMFADQVFAMIPGQYPPVASFEALLGVIAHLGGVSAASVTYYLVPPLGSALAVLALWRLLSSWELRRPQAAFAVAMVYLLFGGAFHASFGNTWVERMWQGKILFISILVPTLLVYLVRALRRGRRCDVLLCSAAAVAGVGLTSTAIYLAPVFLGVAVCAALALGPRMRAVPLLVPIAYLAVLGVAWVALSGVGGVDSGQSGSESSGPGTVDIVTKVLGTGPYLVLGIAAAAVGWAAIRERHARFTVLFLVLTAALAISPLGLAAMDAVGLPESIRWRMMWLVPIPALVGALAAGAGAALGRRGAAFLAVCVALATAIVGLPLWSPDNGVELGRPTLKWSPAVQETHAALVAVSIPGDIIGTTEATGAMVTALSGVYWPVNPRGNYTRGMDAQPAFCAQQRFVVADYAAGARALDAEVVDGIEQLGISVLQLPITGSEVQRLAALGFVETERDGVLRRDLAGSDRGGACAGPE